MAKIDLRKKQASRGTVNQNYSALSKFWKEKKNWEQQKIYIFFGGGNHFFEKKIGFFFCCQDREIQQLFRTFGQI